MHMANIPTAENPLYVFELPIRLWHWSMVLAIMVLVPTGYIIGKPWHSLDGDPTFLFYMGFTQMAHYIAAFVLIIGFIVRIGFALMGNSISRQIFIIPVWSIAWWQDLVSDIRWYLFLDKEPKAHMGHNPLAQLGMFYCCIMLMFMILTGLGMYAQSTGSKIFQPLYAILNFVYYTGGNGIDLHNWHRLGMHLLMAFVFIHIYMVIREEIMGKTSLVTTMFNGFRYLRRLKGSKA